MNTQPLAELSPLPDPLLWRELLSGNRQHIAHATEAISTAGLTDEYAESLLNARRRHARRERRWLWFINFSMPYTERERRSAFLALTALWGALGRELAMALDAKASHFDRDRAHKALVRRRDQRAVKALVSALLEGHALEDWQCISTLGSLGDAQAAEGLLAYLGMDTATDQPISQILEFGVEVGRTLRTLNAQNVLPYIESCLQRSLPRQRIGAALALAGWGDEKLATLLLPLFEDEHPQVRLAAVIAAGELKAAESAIPLQAVISDPDPQVRAAVEGALQQVLTANAQRAVRVGRMQPASVGQR